MCIMQFEKKEKPRAQKPSRRKKFRKQNLL